LQGQAKFQAQFLSKLDRRLLWEQKRSHHIERLTEEAPAAYNAIHCCLVPTE
jgi:hypothetical protein